MAVADVIRASEAEATVNHVAEVLSRRSVALLLGEGDDVRGPVPVQILSVQILDLLVVDDDDRELRILPPEQLECLGRPFPERDILGGEAALQVLHVNDYHWARTSRRP